MESRPQTVVTAPPPSRGMFGTGIPSSVAFAVGVLLFFLPFSEIKCSGKTLMKKTGLEAAMNKDYKAAATGDLFNKNKVGEEASKTTAEPKKNTQYYAIGAMALGVIGLLLSFMKGRSSSLGGMVMGVLAAGASIMLMLEMKSAFNEWQSLQVPKKAQEGTDFLGLDKMTQGLDNNMAMSISFTPWFYVAIVAFLAAAVFSYMRKRPST
ncbi:MAG TPA: hypothetical protein VLJ68_14115 [Chitinophagaceae bacterium]|nr:hypothetical protein [Chitinophagaceae bacterium]